MVTDPTGAIGATMQLPDRAAKRGGGRVVPCTRMHGRLMRFRFKRI
jgi:hypothetical protein